MSTPIDPSAPGADVMAFLTERHLATLTTSRADGTPQVTPVGFTYDPETRLARVITWTSSWKSRHVEREPGQRVALCQVDGGRWLTLYGAAVTRTDSTATREGVERYAERYRQPKDRDDRSVIEITVDRIVGRAG